MIKKEEGGEALKQAPDVRFPSFLLSFRLFRGGRRVVIMKKSNLWSFSSPLLSSPPFFYPGKLISSSGCLKAGHFSSRRRRLISPISSFMIKTQSLSPFSSRRNEETSYPPRARPPVRLLYDWCLRRRRQKMPIINFEFYRKFLRRRRRREILCKRTRGRLKFPVVVTRHRWPLQRGKGY